MVKTYTFSSKKNQDDKETLEALKRLIGDENGNYKVSLKLGKDDEEDADDDHITIPNRGEISENFYYGLTGDRDFLKKKSYVINQQKKIRSIRESSATPIKKLTDLIAATAYDYNSGSTETRIIFANLGKRFRDNSTAPAIVDAILFLAETEIQSGVTRTARQWYDTITSIADKLQPTTNEKQRLQAENQSLYNKVRDLEEQLNAAKKRNNLKQEEIVRLRNQIFFLQNQHLPHGVIFDSFPVDEAYKKKEKDLEDKIKALQEKLGNESVPLSVLAEGLMGYAEEAGIHEAHELFKQLNYLLINVPAWTKNVPGLKAFFKKARKEMEARTINMTGDNATYNENK